jgi:tetratricopeptide (TPR) repeat protein
MDRRWNLLFIVPLILGPLAYLAVGEVWGLWVGLGIGIVLIYAFRPLALPPHLHKAVKQYKRGNLEDALELANQSIAKRDDRWESFHTRSIINFGLTRLSAAEEDARRAIELKPAAYVNYTALGQALYAQGRYGKASDAYYDAIERNGKDATNHLYLALSQFRQEKYKEAAERMAFALDLGIDNSSLNLLGHYVIGRSREETGDEEGAAEAYDNMLDYSHGLEPLQNDMQSVDDYPALSDLKEDVMLLTQRLRRMEQEQEPA